MKPRTFKTYDGLMRWCLNQGRGRAYHVMVMHDNECSPHQCRCKPWYRVEDLTVENYEAGQRSQRAWIKETSS